MIAHLNEYNEQPCVVAIIDLDFVLRGIDNSPIWNNPFPIINNNTDIPKLVIPISLCFESIGLPAATHLGIGVFLTPWLHYRREPSVYLRWVITPMSRVPC